MCSTRGRLYKLPVQGEARQVACAHARVLYSPTLRHKDSTNLAHPYGINWDTISTGNHETPAIISHSLAHTTPQSPVRPRRSVHARGAHRTVRPTVPDGDPSQGGWTQTVEARVEKELSNMLRQDGGPRAMATSTRVRIAGKRHTRARWEAAHTRRAAERGDHDPHPLRTLVPPHVRFVWDHATHKNTSTHTPTLYLSHSRNSRRRSSAHCG